MEPAPEFTELCALQPGNRAFSLPRRPGFAECAPSGRVRLDALACWLQDVAYGDVEDAGLVEVAVWVVRRVRLRVRRWPRFGECFELQTFCSGMGRMWAERRTNVTRAGEATPDVEGVCLWVHLDPRSGRPMSLLDAELAMYGGGGAAQRRVSARLRHPMPPDGVRGAAPTARRWTFRGTELDIAGHVNNAAYWRPLEEELLSGAEEPPAFDGELEYRMPSQAGERLFLRSGAWRWLLDDQGEVYASVAVAVNGR